MYLGKGLYTPNSESKARQTLAVWGRGLNMAYKAGVKIALALTPPYSPTHAPAKNWA